MIHNTKPFFSLTETQKTFACRAAGAVTTLALTTGVALEIISLITGYQLPAGANAFAEASVFASALVVGGMMGTVAGTKSAEPSPSALQKILSKHQGVAENTPLHEAVLTGDLNEIERLLLERSSKNWEKAEAKNAKGIPRST